MPETARVERALGNVRVSTQGSAEGGVRRDAQATALGDYYRRLHGDLVEIYRDNGASGVTANRPGLQALLDHAIHGDSGITEVGVCSFSRLARDGDLLDQYCQRLERAGVRIVSIPEDAGQKAEGRPKVTVGTTS
ncbi:recombinase family protein [Sphingomonas sp. UYP23]